MTDTSLVSFPVGIAIITIVVAFSRAIIDNRNCDVFLSMWQDPNAIEHEQAPTGDLYTVVEKKPKKKGSKKEPSEAELAQMYSVPDKTRKHQEGVRFFLLPVCYMVMCMFILLNGSNVDTQVHLASYQALLLPLVLHNYRRREGLVRNIAVVIKD